MRLSVYWGVALLACAGCGRKSPPVPSEGDKPKVVPVSTTEPGGSAPSPTLSGTASSSKAAARPDTAPFAFPPVAEWGVRETAADALYRIGEPAVPALVRALDSPQIPVRLNAARALSRIGPEAKDAVPALTRMLLTDQDTLVRLTAARALGQIGPAAKPAISGLIQALEQEK